MVETKPLLPILVPVLALALLVAYQVLPFAAYGVPAVSVHKASQTAPTIATSTLTGSYGTWRAYDYYAEATSVDKSPYDWWGKTVTLGLSVKYYGKVEVSDIASPTFLTEITVPPFLVDENVAELKYQNITIEAYSYSFKLNVAWSGDAKVTVITEESWGIIPPGRPSIETLAQSAVTQLVADFNKNAFLQAQILLSIDAPRLGTATAYELRPDYVGIFGMWLQDYRIEGYGSGTAVEGQPQVTGTSIGLYLDTQLTEKAWGVAAPKDEPLLTPDNVFWFDHLAPKGAWFQTQIVNLGSNLLVDTSKAYPNYVEWAWEDLNQAPTFAQWFRVDLGFRTTEDWVVPRIPRYEISEEEKDRQTIIIETEPVNVGTPRTDPSLQNWLDAIWVIVPLVVILVVATIVAVAIYYYTRGKWFNIGWFRR